MDNTREDQEQRRHRGYELAEVSYTCRRYGHAAMQMYARVRTEAILGILDRCSSAGSPVSVLDVGCGTGLTLCGLAEGDRNLQLYGVDISEKMLAEARQKLASTQATAELVVGSAFDLPFPDKRFDAICSTRFIHQYTDNLKVQILREIRRCLKPGGVAIVEFYSFFPWLLRCPFAGARSWNEHFIHCTTHKKLRSWVGRRVEIVPLMIPGCTRLTRVVGLRGIAALRTLLRGCRAYFLFDEYLAVFGKD